MPGSYHHAAAAGPDPRHGRFPSLLQHIHAGDHQRDGRKCYGKHCKRRQQLANKIHLQCDHDSQKQPDPFPALILRLHLFSPSHPILAFDPDLAALMRPLSTRPKVCLPVLFDTKVVPKAMVQWLQFEQQTSLLVRPEPCAPF